MSDVFLVFLLFTIHHHQTRRDQHNGLQLYFNEKYVKRTGFSMLFLYYYYYYYYEYLPRIASLMLIALLAMRVL